MEVNYDGSPGHDDRVSTLWSAGQVESVYCIVRYIIYNERAKRSTFDLFFTLDISLFRSIIAFHIQEVLCHPC